MDTIIELCAGSAAVSLCALGGQKPPVAYAGSKRGYAKAILEEMGAEECTRAVLVEPGPWGRTWSALAQEGSGEHIAKRIRRHYSCTEDPKAVWARTMDDMKRLECDRKFASAHLVRLAGSFGGYENGGFKGPHKHHPNVDGFIPNRQSLAKRLESLDVAGRVTAHNVSAMRAKPFACFAYIDPPYHGTTRYENALPRKKVVKLARRWREAGAVVAISEGEPISALVEQGWRAVDLTEKRQGQGRTNTRSKHEWLTLSPSGKLFLTVDFDGATAKPAISRKRPHTMCLDVSCLLDMDRDDPKPPAYMRELEGAWAWEGRGGAYGIQFGVSDGLRPEALECSGAYEFFTWKDLMDLIIRQDSS
jgi:hypothetical protein